MWKTARLPKLVEAINLEQSSDYTLIGKMERGVHGAWLIRSGDGVRHILKLVAPGDVTEQIERSAKCAALLDDALVRTPKYESVSFAPELGSWYIQEFLSGVPAPWPNDRLVRELVTFNERQHGRAVDGGTNWSEHVLDCLFRDAVGRQRIVANHSAAGKAMVQVLRQRIEPYVHFAPSSGDVVHGDFQHYNAMADETGDALTGYIDWEGAGCGDRAIDLARLLYDVFVSEPELHCKIDYSLVEYLKNGIETLAGRAGLSLYMSYWILQVAEFGVRCGPEKADMFIGVSDRILDVLEL